MAEKQPSQRYTPFILNDEPVSGDTEPGFQFQAYADTLARLIAAKSTRTPLTVGIFGGWGMGKTTLMQAIRYRLDQTEGIENKKPVGPFLAGEDLGRYRRCHTVWFNAWKYSGQSEEMMVALIDCILRQMRDEGFINQVYAALNDPKRPHYKWAEATIAAVSMYLSGGQTELDMSKFSAESRFRTFRPFLDEFQTLFDRLLLWYLRRKVGNAPNLDDEKEGERKKLDQEGALVVFIDDLDRCLPWCAYQRAPF